MLAFGILSDCVRREIPEAEVKVVHANLDFVDWAVDRFFKFDLTRYEFYSRMTCAYGCGEWVFSSALHDVTEWRLDEFLRHFDSRMDSYHIALSTQLHRQAPEFIDRLAQEIVDYHPEFVGFQMGTAALATAKRVKRLDPTIRTVMGGVLCDGDQGAAIHRNFPFIDFVVRGEGEVVLPQLITLSSAGMPLDDIDGLCWVAQDGRRVVNPSSGRPLPVSKIGSPDFTDFYERFADSRASTWLAPWLSEVRVAAGGSEDTALCGSTATRSPSGASSRTCATTRSSRWLASTGSSTCLSSIGSSTWGTSPPSCPGSRTPTTTWRSSTPSSRT
jgi:hypothetical protein